jgi:uncharacterized protein (DUF1330 family)
MSAYAIVDLHILDIEHYLDYQRAIRPLVEAAGARYLARGGEFKVLEGDFVPSRLILIEFPSLEAMEDFYHSEAYQALEGQRRACSDACIVGVKGL